MEIVLYASGWQESSENANEVRDPFMGFTGQQSLFEKSADSQVYQIRKSRLGYFRPATFLAEKPKNGFRVFVVGGSTVQGRPWETETAFAKWLELGLIACEPKSRIEVINCGGVSYASYRLSLIVDELIEYSPDLIILCTGHNEFLEKRTYRVENNLPGFVVSIHQFLSKSRSYRWVRSNVLGFRNRDRAIPEIGEKVITRLDYENGLDLFTPETLQRESVASHFEFNLQRMVSTAVNRGVRILVLSPPSNLKDCFPFKPHAEWKPEDKSEFRDLNLSELESVPAEKRHADFFFFRGLRKLAAGNTGGEQDLERAIDEDICPIRMTSRLRQSLATVVESGQKKFGNDQLMFFDLHKRCKAESNSKIVGSELLVDHVHPSVKTHQKIAGWILELLHQNQLIHKCPDWTQRHEKLVNDHQESLGFGYFQRGQERLKSVLKWSRGRAINPLENPSDQ